MVIRDLSTYSDEAQVPGPRLASVADRLLAFAIDFFLFSPVVHVMLSFILKKIELMRVTAPDSVELMGLMFVGAAITIAFVVSAQTFFLALLGATPGKYFLKLRVRPIDTTEGHKLSVPQAMVRSVIWVLEVALLFVPFLEVLSHRKRRAIHDRAAETVVVTLKSAGDSGPHKLESHFIKQVLVVCTLLVLSWIFFGVGRAYRMTLTGAYKKAELSESGQLCQFVDDKSQNRVDEALALFLADAVSDECVYLESDFALWTVDASGKSWASLAMAVTNRADSKLSDSYLQKVCELSPESEPCEIANRFFKKQKNLETAKSRSSGVASEHWNSLTAKVLLIMSLERVASFEKVSALLEQIDHPALVPFKLKNQVKAYWSAHQFERARGTFKGGVLSLGANSREEISTWMCLEELQQKCSPEGVSEACNDLHHESPTEDLEYAWASIKAKQCSHSTEPVLAKFRDLLGKRKDLKKMAEALLNEEQTPKARQLAIFEDVATHSSGVVKRWALTEWIERASTEAAWDKILEQLEIAERRDWTWQSQVLKAFTASLSTGAFESSHQFAELLGDDKIKIWDLEKEQILAAYRSGDLDEARRLARSFGPQVASRRPASDESFDEVLRQLRSQEVK